MPDWLFALLYFGGLVLVFYTYAKLMGVNLWRDGLDAMRQSIWWCQIIFWSRHGLLFLLIITYSWTFAWGFPALFRVIFAD